MKPNDKEKKAIDWFFWKIATAFCAVFCMGLVAAKTFDYNPMTPAYYLGTGSVSVRPKVWDGIITPSTATAQTIDISAASFSNIQSITITPATSSGLVSTPIVGIQSYTNSLVTVNILQSNSQVVSILGSTVTGLVAATGLANMRLHVHVVGN